MTIQLVERVNCILNIAKLLRTKLNNRNQKVVPHSELFVYLFFIFWMYSFVVMWWLCHWPHCMLQPRHPPRGRARCWQETWTAVSPLWRRIWPSTRAPPHLSSQYHIRVVAMSASLQCLKCYLAVITILQYYQNIYWYQLSQIVSILYINIHKNIVKVPTSIVQQI